MWNPPDMAPAYDIVKGDLQMLHSGGGNFAIATLQCLANDFSGPAIGAPGFPAPGQGEWFALRSSGCTAGASYDSWDPQQAASRDPGIAASGNGCTP